MEGAVFYSDVKDAIEDVKTGNSKTVTRRGNTQTVYETMNQNVGKETYKGLELGVTAFITENVTLGANYTYIRAENRNSEFIVKDVPKHKAYAYADWKITADLSLYLSQTAEHGRYSDDGKNYVKLSGFGVTDAKFTYAFTKNLYIDLGVSNIFDKNYYYTEGYPEEGRVYFSNVKFTF